MKRFCAFVFIAFMANCLFGQQVKYGKKLSSKDVVEYLASDNLEGRASYSKGDTLSKDFIFNQMKKLGLNPGVQDFNLSSKSSNGNTFNIYGYTNSKSGKYIVVGAHYDHLGYGGIGSGSRRPDTIAIHNGADDNASGVAGMLFLAKKYSKKKDLNVGLVFVAFGAEEKGVIGSKYFASNLPVIKNKKEELALKNENILAMINFDMIGYLRNNAITLGGSGTAKEMDSIINCASREYGNALKIAKSPQGYGPSDHSSFYAKNIPVFYITTGATIDYHTPFDDAYKLNFAGIDSVANFAGLIVDNLQGYSNGLSFTETAQSNASPMRMNIKVSLGLMPDVTGQVSNGLRADIIIKDKPAYKAGLKNGDIITHIKDVKINNIEEYMKSLQTLKKGELIVVKVLRDKEELVFNVQL